MGHIAWVLTLIVAGVRALFGVQHTAAVTLHVLWLTARAMPLALAIVGGAAIGAALSAPVGLTGILEHRERHASHPRSRRSPARLAWGN